MTPLQELIISKYKLGDSVADIKKYIDDMGENGSIVIGFVEEYIKTEEIKKKKIECDREIAFNHYFRMQSFPNGLIAGSVAAILGSILWCMVVVLTDRIFSIMSIFIGFIVSFAVNKYGRGLRLEFKVTSTILSLSGIFLGYCFIVMYIFSKYSNVSMWDMKTLLLNKEFYKFVGGNSDPMDVLFYIGAGVYAWVATKTTVTDQMVLNYINDNKSMIK